MQIAKKILVLGIGQSNFLNQLYGGIKKRSNHFDFLLDGFFEIGKETSEFEKAIFSGQYDFSKLKISKFNLLLAVIQFFFTNFFWTTLFFEISQKSGLKEIKNNIKQLARARYIYKKHIEKEEFDMLHFHYCAPDFLRILHFVKPKQKVICSFWGSDLFRLTGPSNVFYVAHALQNATKITVQSPEMALTLQAKYGLELQKKIVDIRFTISEEIYHSIDVFQNEDAILEDFKKQYKIDKPFVIALGHNAFKENNHLLMLEQMKKLPAQIRNFSTILLHLSYGRNEKYIDQLKDFAKANRDLDIVFIEDYVDSDAMAKLRLITSVMVQAPISDALSGAMTEVLYANNAVIAGGWLPYGILRRNGLVFDQFDDFEDLNLKIGTLFHDFENNKFLENKNSIRNFLFPERTSADWIELFNIVND